MKRIRLWRQRTGGFIYAPELVPLEPAQHALCDDADYPWLSQWQWYLIPATYNRLVRCVLWVSAVECRIETMHRMIMTAYYGWDPHYIGHHDRDALNNQRINLYWQKRQSRRREPGGGYGITTLPSMRWPLILTDSKKGKSGENGAL